MRWAVKMLLHFIFPPGIQTLNVRQLKRLSLLTIGLWGGLSRAAWSPRGEDFALCFHKCSLIWERVYKTGCWTVIEESKEGNMISEKRKLFICSPHKRLAASFCKLLFRWNLPGQLFHKPSCTWMQDWCNRNKWQKEFVLFSESLKYLLWHDKCECADEEGKITVLDN